MPTSALPTSVTTGSAARTRLRPLLSSALVPLTLLLGGCGGDDSAPSASSSSSRPASPSGSASTSESASASASASARASAHASASTAATGAPCDALDGGDLKALTGQELGEGSEGRAGTLPACQWGSPSSAGVQVVAVTAQEWGSQLPALIDQVRRSGAFDDAANARRLSKAARLVESGKRLDAAEACRLFSRLAELQGNKPGQDTTVTLLPTGQRPQAISAQTCSEGQFASVLVVRPGITGSRRDIASVTTALRRVREAS